MAGHPQFVVRGALARCVRSSSGPQGPGLAEADRLALEVDLSPVRHCKPWWNACLAPRAVVEAAGGAIGQR